MLNDIVQITASGGNLGLGALSAKGAGSFLKALGTTSDPVHFGLRIEGDVNISLADYDAGYPDADLGGDLTIKSERGIEIAATGYGSRRNSFYFYGGLGSSGSRRGRRGYDSHL